jgi:tetratricopeptide (TPR) repeat protein
LPNARVNRISIVLLGIIALGGCEPRKPPSPPTELIAPALDKIPADKRGLIVAAFQAANDNAADAGVNARLGMLLLAYEQPAAAAAAFQRATLIQPDNFPWFYYLGQAHAAAGHKAEALEAFRKAMAIRPNFVPLQRKVTELRHPEQPTAPLPDPLPESLRDPWMQAVRNLRPEQKPPPPPDERPAHFEKGRDFMAKKQFPKAIAELKQTLEPEDKETPGYLFALSRACAFSGDLVGAVKYGSDAKTAALKYGQTDLVSAIEGHLKRLGDGSQP